MRAFGGPEHPAAGEPRVSAAAVTRSAPEQPDATEVNVLALAGVQAAVIDRGRVNLNAPVRQPRPAVS
jgi:hypothetical protein